MKSTDYREYPEPALVRDAIESLQHEARAQRAEKFLCTRLHLAIAHLENYAQLLDALYLESLKNHKLLDLPLETD
jgi:hypothetical protein